MASWGKFENNNDTQFLPCNCIKHFHNNYQTVASLALQRCPLQRLRKIFYNKALQLCFNSCNKLTIAIHFHATINQNVSQINRENRQQMSLLSCCNCIKMTLQQLLNRCSNCSEWVSKNMIGIKILIRITIFENDYFSSSSRTNGS